MFGKTWASWSDAKHTIITLSNSRYVDVLMLNHHILICRIKTHSTFPGRWTYHVDALLMKITGIVILPLCLCVTFVYTM